MKEGGEMKWKWWDDSEIIKQCNAERHINVEGDMLRRGVRWK